ncbi:hypothetical protein ABPG72_008288 [Tetrahymena utriculariae]
MQDNEQAQVGQLNNQQAENQQKTLQSNHNHQNNHASDLKDIVRVQVSHIAFSIDNSQSNNQNEQIYLQCSLKHINQTFQTHSVQEQQSQYKWSDQFTFEADKQNDNQQLQVEIYEKTHDQNQFFGKVMINLKDFLSDLKEYSREEVQISNNNGEVLGKLSYTVKSYINEDQQNKHQEVNQNKQHNEQYQQNSQENKEKSHETKKQIEHEQQKQDHHEQQKNVHHEQQKEAHHQENKEEHNQNLLQKKEAEHQEENKHRNDIEKKQNNKMHQKETGEGEQKKQQFQNSKLNTQNESSVIEDSKNQKKKRLQDKSLNESIVSSKKKFDYYIAAKNLKSGYGLSEYHSAHTLQISVHSMSFPKGLRFQQSTLERPSAPYTILPSSFDSNNSLRGPSFGSGNRDLLHLSSNPGPGAYELSTTKLKKGSTKGFVFGISRQQCKNAIGLMKSDITNLGGRKYDSIISKDFSNGLKLPALNGSLSSRSLPNYHYQKQKQF